MDINPDKGTKRAEGSSSSPVSIKILDLTSKCRAYHEAFNERSNQRSSASEANQETTALDLSLSSNISAASS